MPGTGSVSGDISPLVSLVMRNFYVCATEQLVHFVQLEYHTEYHRFPHRDSGGITIATAPVLQPFDKGN